MDEFSIEINELKRLSVHELDHVLRLSNGAIKEFDIKSKFSVLIITNFGHIEAEIYDTDSRDDVGLTMLSTAFSRIDDASPPVIFLKNAKITPFGQSSPGHIIEQMALFTDQIVGLSFK
ncbi:hypothetical protein V3851_25995 [Paenibacillus sp. M1]|uniref:SCP2 domain-containing protein n=1 Tax=Paenibacillus haidiansis TaxID=1574488 RepID=A0ABU7VZM5_9BACL